MRDIGKNIKALRKKKGMTQEALAEALFVTRQTVSNYETGRSRPDLDMLVKIADTLGADVTQMLYGLPAGQDRQGEVRRLAAGCLVIAAIFLLMTLPAPLLNELLLRRYVGAMLVSTLVAGLLRPALWLVLGWCVLQGLWLLQVIHLPEERAWVTWARRGVLLVLAVYVVLLLPPMVVGLIQVIQACLGVPNEALVEFPQLPAYTWLMNRLLRFTAFTPQGCALIGGALWMRHFSKH